MTRLELDKMVLRLAREHFVDCGVSDVRILEKIGSDGDEILEMRIIMNAESHLVTKDVLSFVRILRDSLEEQEEERFPVISYIAASELQEMRAGS